MSKKLVVIVVCLMQLASVPVLYASPPQLNPILEPKIEAPKMPDVAIPKVSADKPPGFLKDFLEIIKKHAVKKPTKENLNDSIATLNGYISILDSLLKRLTPLPPKKLIEFSLHAIEQSKYLSLFDSKNYYRTERQWADYVGRTHPGEELPALKREPGGKTLYGFHPFWMGLNYYHYNFELYDRVAYYGYSVDPATGLSVTRFPAHSFATSQIVRKANERSAGRCKIDLCVASYGLENNSTLFSSSGWEARLEALTNEVTALVKTADAGGICLDFQQVPLADSSKFIQLVTLFCNKLKAISPGNYQISMVLPSYSEYFPYTMSGKNLADLYPLVDRFIVMGYSSYSGLYNPAKDTLASAITRDVLWNVLLVDDGINHYSLLAKSSNDSTMSTERVISEKLLLSLPACEIKVLGVDSVQIVRYSDLKLLKLDEGYLKSFNEKLTYASLKNLKGVALWSMGYDNSIGVKDLHGLLAAYVTGGLKKDEDLLKAMEKLISENKSLTMDIEAFFPVTDTSPEASIPLPEVLRVDLPSSEGLNYKTAFDKEVIIIQHIVAVCLIVFLFFACIGVIIALFSESVRESLLTRENAIFLFIIFSLVGLVTLLKNLNVINNTVFLFALGIVLGTVIPFVIKKKQRKIQQEDRP
jgi:hypothetical protein